MGNVHMEATQINYRGGSKKMSVEEAIKAAGTEITPEEKEWIDTIPELASQEIIAPEFDADEGVYAVGDLVIYQGGLYQFTTAHETAGAWNPDEVAAVKISDELDALKSGLINDSFNVTTSQYFDIKKQMSHYITNKVVHICALLQATEVPSSNSAHIINLPSGVSLAVSGSNIPIYRSDGQYTALSTIVYGYTADTYMLTNKPDIEVNKYYYVDFVAKIN